MGSQAAEQVEDTFPSFLHTFAPNLGAFPFPYASGQQVRHVSISAAYKHCIEPQRVDAMPTQQDVQPGDAVTDLIERLISEGPIGMGGAARLYGSSRDGKPTHPSTPCRHAITGVKLLDGRTLLLESYVISGKRMTSRAAVMRFIRAQQGNPSDSTPTPTSGRSLVRRKRETAAAVRKLDELLA